MQQSSVSAYGLTPLCAPSPAIALVGVSTAGVLPATSGKGCPSKSLQRSGRVYGEVSWHFFEDSDVDLLWFCRRCGKCGVDSLPSGSFQTLSVFPTHVGVLFRAVRFVARG